MAIRTSQAITGFISDDPRLSYTQDGQARFYARVGIKHFERTGEGQFKRLANTYHDLIQFGRAAELSYERFSKGDEFLAQGEVREYTRPVDGQSRTDEQFLARRIGHDPNTTTYTVDRRPAAEREGADREAAGRQPAEHQAAQQEEPSAARTSERAQQLGAPAPVAPAEPAAAEAAAR
ncbi:single-stranded DNA-binding protein [Microbacterium rhizophilus]|uniref:single-stranded DNA-binding protein n=1 Tax=Microbacterium rhizophilus TaxID=3138934 RepID=UPI0031E8C936